MMFDAFRKATARTTNEPAASMGDLAARFERSRKRRHRWEEDWSGKDMTLLAFAERVNGLYL
jgi:hypothetical protein